MNMKVSLITAVYNAASTIRTCLNSVNAQSYKYIEHIVVDGASTDDTCRIVRTLESRKIKIVSEPDQGIYDAMNKGINLATGDVIGILNADDFYAHQGVIARIVHFFQNNPAVACYGDLVYVDRTDINKIIRYWKAGDYHPHSFYYGWMPPHPTFFVRRKVYEQYGNFNLSLGSSADYELMLRLLLKHKVPVQYIPEVLVKMRSGGVSNASLRNRLVAHMMDRRAWRVNGLTPYPWTLLLKPISKIRQFWSSPKEIEV